MRRVLRHAIAGTVVSAVAATAVLMTASPLVEVAANGTPSLAVPAVGTAPPSGPASAAPTSPQREFARAERPDRGTERPSAADESAAVTRRATALDQQGQKITQAAKQAAADVAAARAQAAAAQARAEAAKRARYAALGYEPGTTDPREIARQMMANKWGWGAEQYTCLDNIVMRESGWQIDATNPSSGAYGIPQSLPATKMATVAADWRTNPATQITWMLGYLEDRYGTPCGGWAFKADNGWY